MSETVASNPDLDGSEEDNFEEIWDEPASKKFRYETEFAMKCQCQDAKNRKSLKTASKETSKLILPDPYVILGSSPGLSTEEKERDQKLKKTLLEITR